MVRCVSSFLKISLLILVPRLKVLQLKKKIGDMSDFNG